MYKKINKRRHKLRELRGKKKVKLVNILFPIKCLLYEVAVNPHLLDTWFEFAVDLSCMKTRTFDIVCQVQTAGKSRSSKACES